MKKLMLVRHAKSDWGDAHLPDFDRPLSDRGLSAAPEMATRVLKKGLVPQHIITSPALRAKTTAAIFADILSVKSSSEDATIYEASYAALLKVVNGIADEYQSVAMFGHNPGISDLIYGLTGDVADVPTCAVVVIRFNVDSWAEISGDTGRVEYYDTPKGGD